MIYHGIKDHLVSNPLPWGGSLKFILYHDITWQLGVPELVILFLYYFHIKEKAAATLLIF